MNADERDGTAGSVRPRSSSTAPMQVGVDGVRAARNAAHFGAAAASYESWEYADSAATALDQPETRLDLWPAGLRDLYPHTHPATNGAVR